MPILALLLLLAIEEFTPVVRGRLCIGESKSPLEHCSDTTGRVFDLPASDRGRLFVWTSADGSAAQLGTIAPKGEKVDLDAGERTIVELSLAGEPSRGWPADVKATVEQAGHTWWWTVDARSATRLRRLVVPRTPSTLAFRAPHHRALLRVVEPKEEKLAVGALTLLPLPQARGVVVDAEGKPIAGALVSRPDATVCATANEQGVFACELEELLPEALVVSSSGYGERDIPLPRVVREDLDLGRIELKAGRRLTVRVVRPEAGPGSVTLFVDVKERYEHAKLKRRELQEREEEVRFDVGSGDYVLLVEGNRPLERLEMPLTVKDADVSETITVEPYRVVGTVRFGDDPLVTGKVGLFPRQHTWRGELDVRGGSFEGVLWQRKDLRAHVSSPELGVPESVEPPMPGSDDPTRWDIRLEKRMIVGRVLDAETGKPVPDAKMQLTARQESRTLYTSVKLESDGAYRILSMRPGTYSLRVTSPAHVPYSMDVVVTPEEKIKTVDIALEHGVVQPLDLVLASGAPARGATLLEGVQPDRHNPQYIFKADGDGRFALRGRPGQVRLLYVVPQDGSFAIVRVTIPRSNDAAPLRVVIPEPSGALRVRTMRDDQPVPAPLLIRYNGDFVPGAILRFVTRDLVGTRQSGEGVLPRLPPGFYEVWATAGERDEEQLIASNGALRPPARVGLSAGEVMVHVIAPLREVRGRE